MITVTSFAIAVAAQKTSSNLRCDNARNKDNEALTTPESTSSSPYTAAGRYADFMRTTASVSQGLMFCNTGALTATNNEASRRAPVANALMSGAW